MIWHYDLCGAEPIVRDVSVYDAASFAIGELVMLGATAAGSNDQGVAFVTAYVSASANEAVDALGILLEVRATATTALTSGGTYLKAIVNPFAVYLAEYDSADTMTAASSSTTTITVTDLENDIDTGFVYAVTGSPTGNTGALRFLTASAAGSATMDSALPSTDTGSTLIKILPVNHRLTALNTASTKLGSNAAAGSDVSLHILENYISSDTHPLAPLRYEHKGLNALSNAKFYADVVLIDHIYNPNA